MFLTVRTSFYLLDTTEIFVRVQKLRFSETKKKDWYVSKHLSCTALFHFNSFLGSIQVRFPKIKFDECCAHQSHQDAFTGTCLDSGTSVCSFVERAEDNDDIVVTFGNIAGGDIAMIQSYILQNNFPTLNGYDTSNGRQYSNHFRIFSD